MKCDVKLAVIGLRNMNPPYKNLVMNLEIPGYEME